MRGMGWWGPGLNRWGLFPRTFEGSCCIDQVRPVQVGGRIWQRHEPRVCEFGAVGEGPVGVPELICGGQTGQTWGQGSARWSILTGHVHYLQCALLKG